MEENYKMSIIYTSMVFAGILLSTIFSLLLTYSPFGFIAILCLYMLAYSIYMFVLMIIHRKKFDKKDVSNDIANYVSLFNILLTTSMFFFAIVLRHKIRKSACFI